MFIFFLLRRNFLFHLLFLQWLNLQKKARQGLQSQKLWREFVLLEAGIYIFPLKLVSFFEERFFQYTTRCTVVPLHLIILLTWDITRVLANKGEGSSRGPVSVDRGTSNISLCLSLYYLCITFSDWLRTSWELEPSLWTKLSVSKVGCCNSCHSAWEYMGFFRGVCGFILSSLHLCTHKTYFLKIQALWRSNT